MSNWYRNNYPSIRRLAMAAPFALMKTKPPTRKTLGPVYGPKPKPNQPRPIRRRRRRAPMKKSSKTSTLASRIRKLETRQTDTLSKVIYKYDTKDNLRPDAGEARYGYQNAVGSAQIELALAQCRYFNPSSPGTLITGSLATPTFAQNILVSASSQMIIKNNYQVPCIVTYGVAFPREDTSIQPNLARTNGLTDVGNPDSASTLISFNDSPQFRELWRYRGRSKYLRPGQQIIVKHFQKQFNYDPALQDSQTATYQNKVKSAVYLFRCQGILGHDGVVASEQGMLPAGIDVYVTTTYIITYNSGGASIRTIHLNETASQSFTNTPVVSQPVVDNQSYSIG